LRKFRNRFPEQLPYLDPLTEGTMQLQARPRLTFGSGSPESGSKH
jgi:hypothetical protein